MGLFGTIKRTMVVDLAAVLKAKGARGRAVPRQQLQVLRSLSRLMLREKVNVTAVLVGPPLNKAPHNKKLDGVRVRYATSDEKLTKELLRALNQAGLAGVLVTQDVALEKKVIRSGKETLRVSTFCKLLDDGNEPLNDQGNESRGNNRNNRNNRNNPNPRNNNRDRGPRPARKNDRPQKAESKSKAHDEISQMIDLVE